MSDIKIWVDADACPVAIRQIICRAAERRMIQTTFLANQFLPVPTSEHVRFVQVTKGFDVADNEIAQRVGANDLVITQDIPLAADVIEKKATALSPRGELYTQANIRARLTMRNFMDELRGSGIHTGGPSALGKTEIKQFADHLDRYLQQKR